MKKFLIASSTLLVSTLAFANSHAIERSSGAYVGAGLDFYTETELSYGGYSSTLENDMGFNALAGYEIINGNFGLGMELEYRNFGEVSAYGESVDGYGIFVNVKPTYYFPDTSIFVSALVGVGSQTFSDDYGSESEVSLQYGADVGYSFTEHFDAVLGLRGTYAEIYGLDISVYGAQVGLKYRF